MHMYVTQAGGTERQKLKEENVIDAVNVVVSSSSGIPCQLQVKG